MPTETARGGDPGPVPARPRISIVQYFNHHQGRWQFFGPIVDNEVMASRAAQATGGEVFTIPGSAETRAGVEEVMKLVEQCVEVHRRWERGDANARMCNDSVTALESAIRRLAGEQA